MLCLPAETLAATPTEALVEIMRMSACAVGPFALERANEARAWLVAGAQYALFLPPASTAMPLASAIAAAGKEVAIPSNRMMLLLDTPDLEDAAAFERFATDVESLAAPTGAGCYECCHKETCGVVSGIALAVPSSTSERTEVNLLGLLGPIAARDRLQVFIGGLSSCAQPVGVGQLHHKFSLHVLAPASLAVAADAAAVAAAPPRAVVELPSPAASLYPLFASTPLELGSCVAACVRTDRSDGLFPTLVLEADGAALGLVYSSPQSIGAALRCGRGVYWSRSRQSLWRKGDTSGAWQTLQRIRLDCDADALCFTVTQHGEPPAFCHKTSLSCWGAASGLHALQLTLRDRLRSAPAGSYTKRLFDDAQLLRNKLVEEAQELAEATEPDHVAAEAADLVYFAMVRCVAAGVGLTEIGAHLDKRALKLDRRPGHSKKERIAAGDAILAARKDKGADAKGRPSYAWLPLAAVGVYVTLATVGAVARRRS